MAERIDHTGRRPDARRRNLRTAAALASVALVFFLGVLFSRRMGGVSAVMTVAGFALMVALAIVVAVGARKR